MGEHLRKILNEAVKKKNNDTKKKNDDTKKNGKNKKMLNKLHELDDRIEEFIDSLEDQIIAVEDNPMFVKKAHQLLADMSKEYSEFIMALRAIVNAVDRKGQVLPAFEKQESRVRDVLDGQGNGPPPTDEEAPPEEELPPEEDEDDGDEYELKVAKKGDKKKKDKKKKSPVKEALEMVSESNEDTAFREMSFWLKNMKQKMNKCESSVKKKVIDMNVADTFMRLAKVDEEDFFDYFWG